MFKDTNIFVAGHRGLIGSALVTKLRELGSGRIITSERDQLDLTDKSAVFDFFAKEHPEYVFLAAGKVGGILSNQRFPADYYHTNIAIQDNIFEACKTYNVKATVFYGSSCVYPKACVQPIKEDCLFTGPIESTSEAYAAAKIGGLVACKSYNLQYARCRFIALVPNSTYGPNDNFNLEDSHVLSALIRRFHEAKIQSAPKVTLWGSGEVRREFIFSDDVAEATLFAVKNRDLLDYQHTNIGTGIDYTIKELAMIIQRIVQYDGDIEWDRTKPDGAKQKLLDCSKFKALGWRPNIEIESGIRQTYHWYVTQSCQQERVMT